MAEPKQVSCGLIGVLLVVLLALIAVLQARANRHDHEGPADLAEVEAFLADNPVSELYVQGNEWTLVAGEQSLHAHVPWTYEERLPELARKGVRVLYTAEPHDHGLGSPMQWIVWLLPMLILLLVIVLAMRRMTPNLDELQKPPFEELMGLPGEGLSFGPAGDELLLHLAALKGAPSDPKLPRRFLLTGPPGSGKTTLVRVGVARLAWQALGLDGARLVELFTGVGATRVRKAFKEAREQAPALIVIDRVDLFASRRTIPREGGATDEGAQTLGALLTELENLEPEHELAVILVTDRPDRLDEALLAAHRIERTQELPEREAGR